MSNIVGSVANVFSCTSGSVFAHDTYATTFSLNSRDTHVLKTSYVASILITVLTWKPTYRQALLGLKHSGIETADTLFSLFLCQACTRTSHVRQYESADIMLETWHSNKMRICRTSDNLKSVLRGEHFKYPRFSICTLIHIYTLEKFQHRPEEHHVHPICFEKWKLQISTVSVWKTPCNSIYFNWEVDTSNVHSFSIKNIMYSPSMFISFERWTDQMATVSVNRSEKWTLQMSNFSVRNTIATIKLPPHHPPF